MPHNQSIIHTHTTRFRTCTFAVPCPKRPRRAKHTRLRRSAAYSTPHDVAGCRPWPPATECLSAQYPTHRSKSKKSQGVTRRPLRRLVPQTPRRADDEAGADESATRGRRPSRRAIVRHAPTDSLSCIAPLTPSHHQSPNRPRSPGTHTTRVPIYERDIRIPAVSRTAGALELDSRPAACRRPPSHDRLTACVIFIIIIIFFCCACV